MYVWFTPILLLISLIWLKLQNVAACAIAALVCASMSTLRAMKYVSFIGPTVFNERCGRKISNGIWCSPNPTYRASAFWNGRTVTGTSPQPTVFRWWNSTITLRLAFLCTWGICVSLHTSVFGPVSQSLPETYFGHRQQAAIPTNPPNPTGFRVSRKIS